MKYLIFVISSLISIQCQAQLIHDESYTDASFWEFRLKLEQSIQNKDTTAFKELMADTVFESKNGCSICPKDQFFSALSMSSEDEANMWSDLQSIVRYGFSRINQESNLGGYFFEAPSFRKNSDQFTSVVLLGENINIREKPHLKSPVLQQASFEAFDCDCNIADMTESTYQEINGLAWLEIKLKNTQKGYVAVKHTSYQLSRSIIVRKVNGDWKITAYSYPPA